MLRGYYEETAPVELKLKCTFRRCFPCAGLELHLELHLRVNGGTDGTGNKSTLTDIAYFVSLSLSLSLSLDELNVSFSAPIQP